MINWLTMKQTAICHIAVQHNFSKSTLLLKWFLSRSSSVSEVTCIAVLHIHSKCNINCLSLTRCDQSLPHFITSSKSLTQYELFKILHLSKQGYSEKIIQDRPKTYGGCPVEKERGTELGWHI